MPGSTYTSPSHGSPPPARRTSPASIAATGGAKNIPETAAPDALSVPVADISLRNRPELLEQLVQVYRAQLAAAPNDATALAALNQLQQRSLSELEAIIRSEDDASAVRSLAIVARLFPEVNHSARCKYLTVRMNRIPRETAPAPAPASAPSSASVPAAAP